jgi:hypothetical protein
MIFALNLLYLLTQFISGKDIKKDGGSSKTSTEVKKPTGVKIKSEVETSKAKVT